MVFAVQSSSSGVEFVRRSPNGRWTLTFRDHNLWLKSAGEPSEVQLTYDGSERLVYDADNMQESAWSSDNNKVAIRRMDFRKVGDPENDVTPGRAGGVLYDIVIIDVQSQKHVPIDPGEEATWPTFIKEWHGSELLLGRMKRGATELIAANSTTGKTRLIVQENLPGGFHGSSFSFLWVDDKRFIWKSHRDGWSHLYLYNLQGTLIRRLTEGRTPVERVITTDKDGWVYFAAHGDLERPYRTQLYRVSLDGTGHQRLAEDTGQQSSPEFSQSWQQVSFSPSKKYFVFNRSTPSQPSVVELRRANGDFVMELSATDPQSPQGAPVDST